MPTDFQKYFYFETWPICKVFIKDPATLCELSLASDSAFAPPCISVLVTSFFLKMWNFNANFHDSVGYAKASSSCFTNTICEWSLSGKTGNVMEFDSCQWNMRNWSKVREYPVASSLRFLQHYVHYKLNCCCCYLMFWTIPLSGLVSPSVCWFCRLLLSHEHFCRLFWVDLIKWVWNVLPSTKFLQFQWNLACR